MKRGILLLLAVFVAIAAQGCMFDVQNAEIMRPPKLTTELEGVRTALDEFYGRNLKLVNPSSGILRAAIQFVDLNGDERNEAVAFFKDQNEQNAIKVAILYKKDKEERWRSLPAIVGIGYDIDQVGFPDLDGDGTREIVVGWLGGSLLSKGLSVYKAKPPLYAEDTLFKQYEEIFREVYTNFHIADLDMDGTDELVTFLLSRPDNKAEASLFTLVQGVVKRQDQVSLAHDAQRYERIISGLVEDGRHGIALDASLSGGATFSEVLVERDGKLIKRFGAAGSSETSPTYRFDYRLTEDVDQDGWIEIPTLLSPSGYDRVARRDVPWITVWNHWDSDGALVPVMKTYDDHNLGFRVALPEQWDSTVTLTRNDQGIAFVEIQEDGIQRVKILEILVIKRSDAEQVDAQMKSLGFFELARTMDLFYYGKVFPSETLTEEEFGISGQQLQDAFEVLN